MEQFEFKIDPFFSFFAILEQGFCLSKVDHDVVLNTFDGKMNALQELREQLCAYPSDIPVLQGANNEKEQNAILYSHLKELSGKVYGGQITNIDRCKEFLSSRFGIKTEGIDGAYQAYRSFFEDNRNCIEANFKGVCDFYENASIKPANLPTDAQMPKTTGAYLDAMRHFFSVPSDQKPTIYLHAFPDDPHLSGWSTDNSPHQTFCTKRLEDDDKYVGDTNLLKRRMGTAMHEATHWMFANSPIMEEFKKVPDERVPAIQQFISTMETYFDKKKSENIGETYPNISPLGALHEALASSTSPILRPDSMDNFDYKTAQMYYGFNAGNELARVVYPIFHEYIASGKKISDGFFERVVSDKEFQRCFGAQDHSEEQTKKSSIGQILRECSNAKGKGVDESQSDVFAPVRTPVPQQLDAASVMMLRNQNKTNGH